MWKSNGDDRRMVEVAWTVFVSVIVSIICNKVLTVHTLNVLDGYIEEVMEMLKESIRDTYLGEQNPKRG